MIENKYSIDTNDNCIKIYINDVLHLALIKDELIGIQSWLKGDKYLKYSIEFTFKTTTMVSEYDDINKWKSILSLLDKEVRWSKVSD